MKHKHCELIKAWADGAEIQYKDQRGDWIDFPSWYEPVWNSDTLEYRIKPEPKPDFSYSYIVCDNGGAIQVYNGHVKANLHLIFDGETNKLKSAGVIK